ncbi:hypothetical protein [Mangrovibacterium lignilyticum]|uniref:hypothetical protein n=1 Tax=Mangrovibacterium lignilyticum TaxID=2668052 RepID=UPI0013D670BE|nr:hypothetical protein [Mangrovibacterium lignilyticum]
MKETWEKVIECATMPTEEGYARRQRKGVRIELNGEKVIEGATFACEDAFLKVFEKLDGKIHSSYYDWSDISSIKTDRTGSHSNN